MSLTKADPNKQGWEDSVKCLISILQHNIYISTILYIYRNSLLYAKLVLETTLTFVW